MDAESAGIIGLEKEFRLMINALQNGVPVILEGEAGTGKTELAKASARALKRELFRVDGDQELSSMKMQGWFDPPLVLQQGYSWKSFIPGSLSTAMSQGGVFLFNEVNRAPSECINGTLSAIDERVIHIPRLGTIKAEEGFTSIFTCNPLDRVGTNPLPQAFFDRCVWIEIGHLPLELAKEIVVLRTGETEETMLDVVCKIVEGSRTHRDTISGGSIRAAIFMVKLLRAYRETDDDPLQAETVLAVSQSALMKKIKLRYDSELNEAEVIEEIVNKVINMPVEKKN